MGLRAAWIGAILAIAGGSPGELLADGQEVVCKSVQRKDGTLLASCKERASYGFVIGSFAGVSP